MRCTHQACGLHVAPLKAYPTMYHGCDSDRAHIPTETSVCVFRVVQGPVML